MITPMTTATTVWLLGLTTDAGLTSLQSVHARPAACEAARDLLAEQVSPRETFVKQRCTRDLIEPSPYYTVRCEAKERLR